MRTNFQDAMDHLDESEGGYVNHPKDPGGATNRGVTNATYKAWRTRQKLPPKHVKYISQREVEAIYKEMYWDKVKGDDLPSGLDYVAFDAAVNSGPSRGAKWLQKALGVTADGKIGPQTLKAAEELTEAGEIAVIDRALDYRLGFMKSLRIWSTFGRGWARRVDKVRRVAKEWARLPDEQMFDTPKGDRPSLFELIMEAIKAIFERKERA